MEGNEDNSSYHKININWDNPTKGQLHLNPYK